MCAGCLRSMRPQPLRNISGTTDSLKEERLKAPFRHTRVGLQRAAMHQCHDYDGKAQRRDYQALDLVWIHNITLGREKGSKLLFL